MNAFRSSDGIELAALAVAHGIAHESHGFDFCGWLIDTFSDSDVDRVRDLSLRTLYGRFLDARGAK